MANLADFLGGSALAQACGKGCEGIIRVLLEAGPIRRHPQRF